MIHQTKDDKVMKLLQKPEELMSGSHARSPYIPTLEQMRNFKLPLVESRVGHKKKAIPVNQIKRIAATAELADFGIDKVPPGRNPEMFLEGFRWGLGHNRRTDVRKMTRSHNHGFCFAKFIYKKFANGSTLSAPGSMWFKITADE